MQCPFCKHPDTLVTDSRIADGGASVRRRRRCVSCEKRCTTYEYYDRQLPVVVKRSRARVPYDREKMLFSINLALRKRAVPPQEIESLVGRIEQQLLDSMKAEVKSQKIGDMIMRELKKIDKVAYIRYASVYHNFTGPEEMQEFAGNLTKGRNRASSE